MLLADRDPFIQSDVDGRSASVIQIESLGKGGIAAILLITVLALVVAGGAWTQANVNAARQEAAETRMNDKIVAAEKRVMDFAHLAQQEARIATDKAATLSIELQSLKGK